MKKLNRFTQHYTLIDLPKRTIYKHDDGVTEISTNIYRKIKLVKLQKISSSWKRKVTRNEIKLNDTEHENVWQTFMIHRDSNHVYCSSVVRELFYFIEIHEAILRQYGQFFPPNQNSDTLTDGCMINTCICMSVWLCTNFNHLCICISFFFLFESRWYS